MNNFVKGKKGISKVLSAILALALVLTSLSLPALKVEVHADASPTPEEVLAPSSESWINGCDNATFYDLSQYPGSKIKFGRDTWTSVGYRTVSGNRVMDLFNNMDVVSEGWAIEEEVFNSDADYTTWLNCRNEIDSRFGIFDEGGLGIQEAYKDSVLRANFVNPEKSDELFNVYNGEFLNEFQVDNLVAVDVNYYDNNEQKTTGPDLVYTLGYDETTGDFLAADGSIIDRDLIEEVLLNVNSRTWVGWNSYRNGFYTTTSMTLSSEDYQAFQEEIRDIPFGQEEDYKHKYYKPGRNTIEIYLNSNRELKTRYGNQGGLGFANPMISLKLNNIAFVSTAAELRDYGCEDVLDNYIIRFKSNLNADGTVCEDRISSSATYSKKGIVVTNPTEGEYIYVAWNDGSASGKEGDHVVSFPIESDKTIYTSEDLPTMNSNCKVWIEKEAETGNIFAKEVSYAEHVHRNNFVVSSTNAENDTISWFCGPDCDDNHTEENAISLTISPSATVYNFSSQDVYRFSSYSNRLRFIFGNDKIESFCSSIGYSVDDVILKWYRISNGIRNSWDSSIDSVSGGGKYYIDFTFDDATITTTMDVKRSTDALDFVVERTAENKYILKNVSGDYGRTIYLMVPTDTYLERIADGKTDIAKAVFDNEAKKIDDPYIDFSSSAEYYNFSVCEGEEFTIPDSIHNEEYGIIFATISSEGSTFRPVAIGYADQPEIGESKRDKLHDYHRHQFHYILKNNMYCLYCDTVRGCEHCDCYGEENAHAIVLSGDTFTYNGEKQGAKISETDREIFFKDDPAPEITYYVNSDCTIPTNTDVAHGKADSEGGCPEEIGTYYAAILVDVDGLDVPISKHEFKIEKKEREGLTINFLSFMYDKYVTDANPTILGTIEEPGEVTWYYATDENKSNSKPWNDEQISNLLPGNYYVYAEISETEHYKKYTFEPVMFTVSENTGLTYELAIMDYYNVYDGKPHGITARALVGGVTFKFGLTEGVYDLTEMPTFTDVTKSGGEKVYYQASKPGYKTYKNYASVTITKKSLNVEINASNKNYDGTKNAELSYTVDAEGLIPGDEVIITGLQGQFESADVGENIAVNIDTSNYQVSGKGANNYKIIFTNADSVKANINKAPVKIVKNPTAKENVVSFDKNSDVTVLEEGIVEGGSFAYYVDSIDEERALSEIPVAKTLSIGKHKIYYKVKPDKNHKIVNNDNLFIEVEITNGSLSVKDEDEIEPGTTDSEATTISSKNLKDFAKEEMVDGKDVVIELNAKSMKESELSKECKDLFDKSFDSLFPGYNDPETKGAYHKEIIDITIDRSVSGSPDEKIVDTIQPIELIINYPLNETGKDISIFRNHENKLAKFEKLPAKPASDYEDGTFYVDKENNKIYMYSRFFSEFLIAYVVDGHLVSFETNGGNLIESVMVADNGIVGKLPIPVKENETFYGWYQDEDCTNSFTSETRVTSDITLYARYGIPMPYVVEESVEIKEPEKKVLSKNGDTIQLEAIIVPSYATYKSLKWSSSDESVATVNSEGLVTAISEGTVTITVETLAGKKASITLTVKYETNKEDEKPEIKITDSLLKKNALLLNQGLKSNVGNQKIVLNWGEVDNADGYYVYVAYYGDKFELNREIKQGDITKATITKIGEKTINQSKVVKLYVKAYKIVDGKKVEFGKSITLYAVGLNNKTYTNPKSIKLLSSTNLKLKVGSKSTIKAEIVLKDNTKKLLSSKYTAKFRYASSNTKIATVDKNGKIVAKKKGTWYIYVYAANGYSKKIKVTVK